VWRIHKATLYATRQRIQSPPSERAASKLAMIITRRNEKPGQSTSIALVIIRHFGDVKCLCFITRYSLTVSITLIEFTSGIVY